MNPICPTCGDRMVSWRGVHCARCHRKEYNRAYRRARNVPERQGKCTMCPLCAGLGHRVPRGTVCICGTQYAAEPETHATDYLYRIETDGQWPDVSGVQR